MGIKIYQLVSVSATIVRCYWMWFPDCKRMKEKYKSSASFAIVNSLQLFQNWSRGRFVRPTFLIGYKKAFRRLCELPYTKIQIHCMLPAVWLKISCSLSISWPEFGRLASSNRSEFLMANPQIVLVSDSASVPHNLIACPILKAAKWSLLSKLHRI